MIAKSSPTHAPFKDFVDREAAKWKQVVTDIGAKL
jgi:hypothetical protein